jgi:hypothetical protein
MSQQIGVQGKLEVEVCHARAAFRVLQKATIAAPDGSTHRTRDSAMVTPRHAWSTIQWKQQHKALLGRDA